MDGSVASSLPGLIAFVAGAGLVAAPWWSATLPRSDYPLVVILGMVFAGIGLYAAIPEDRLPRLRALAMALFLGAFGIICAALALTPFHPETDGAYAIGGVHGFRVSEAMPWWARIVAGFFALLLGGLSLLTLWGLVRGAFRPGDDGPPRVP